jgi:hypothetical protein
LLAAHVMGVIGTSWVTVAFADSLFFGLDVHASRSQVLRYLLITLIPVAALSRCIGPAVDRVRGGPWRTAMFSNLLRAACAVGLAASMQTPLFFAWAMLLLIANKMFTVSRYAILPTLVTEPSGLVSANVRLTKWGSVCGAAALSVGALFNHLAGPRSLLLASTVAFAAAAMFRPARPGVTQSAAARSPRRACTGKRSRDASIPFVTIRWAVGLFAFATAFSLRRDDAPRAVLAAIGVAYAAGAFLGNLQAPLSRRRMTEERMIQIGLAATAAAGLLAAGLPSYSTFVAGALTIGFAATHSRQAFDSIVQSEIADGSRGRGYALFETRAQICWVVGAASATTIMPRLDLVWAAIAVALLVSLAPLLRAEEGSRLLPLRLSPVRRAPGSPLETPSPR